MWTDVLSRIIEKQNMATQELSKNYASINLNSKNDASSIKGSSSIDVTSIGSINQLKQNQKNQTKSKRINQRQEKRKANQASPIHGFRFVEETSQNQQLKMPSPKLLISPESVSSVRKPDPNQIRFSQKTQQSRNPKQQLQRLSIMTNAEPNPQDIGSFPSSKKQTHSLINNEHRQKYKTEKLSNVRIKSINLVNLKARKSIKTEINASVNQREDSSQQRQFSGSNKQVDGNHSFSINSNVVSYCQSLKQSHINQEPESQKIQKSKSKKLKQKSPKQKNFKRYKTEEKQKHQELAQYLKNQQQIRTQLRVVYQKKYKLQQKLKKLNRQLQKLSVEQTSRAIANLNKINSPPQIHIKNGYVEAWRPKMFANGDSDLKTGISMHQRQLESSKKAIQFIQKMSKESLKRRISYHQKINKDIYDRVRSHVCVNCSRIKCEMEALEGEERNQRAI